MSDSCMHVHLGDVTRDATFVASSKMAGSSSLEAWMTWAFSPTIPAILVTLLISLISPILLHYFFYRKSISKELPTFLLTGPSGSGKTSLLTLVCASSPASSRIVVLTSIVRKRQPLHHPHQPSASNGTMFSAILDSIIRRPLPL